MSIIPRHRVTHPGYIENEDERWNQSVRGFEIGAELLGTLPMT